MSKRGIIMSKTGLVAVLCSVLAMTVVSAAPAKSETELAVFGPYGVMEDVSSDYTPVIVGTNVLTYTPGLIELYLSESLVANTEISHGWHLGKARCLKKNGPEGGRLDFYFDCTANDLSTCPYRLIVRFGIYDRKSDIVVFDLAEMQLYAAGTEPEQLKLDYASFSVAFQAEDDGDSELPISNENCRNGKDDDGDGLVDCDDPDCSGTKFCP